MQVPAPIFDNRITLGTIVQILTWICTAAFFLFKRYNRSEEDSTKLEEHGKLLKELGELQAKGDIRGEKQQILIEQMDKRIVRIEDEFWKRERN